VTTGDGCCLDQNGMHLRIVSEAHHSVVCIRPSDKVAYLVLLVRWQQLCQLRNDLLGVLAGWVTHLVSHVSDERMLA
jgi:hypothetical protein